MYSGNSGAVVNLIHVAHTLNSGLSVNNAFYTHRPIGILYKSQ